jgi:hypothetical protein
VSCGRFPSAGHDSITGAASMEPKEDGTAAAIKIEELLCPPVFPHPITHLELRETHVSWVILTGSVGG